VAGQRLRHAGCDAHGQAQVVTKLAATLVVDGALGQDSHGALCTTAGRVPTEGPPDRSTAHALGHESGRVEERGVVIGGTDPALAAGSWPSEDSVGQRRMTALSG
jgi:hypothetical protein